MSNLPYNMPGGWATGPAMNPHDVTRIATALERIADALAKALEGGVLYTKDADRD